jgi:hypothetical protein
MVLHEIDTPIGTMRLAIPAAHKAVRMAVLDTDDGPLFPASTVVNVDTDVGEIWLKQVLWQIQRGAREAVSARVAEETAPTFVAYIRNLGDDVSYHFTSDDPDDLDDARKAVVRGLTAALRMDDPYQATKAFERDVYFGQADITLVDLMRSTPMLGRVIELASDRDTLIGVAAEMERKNLSKSQMLTRIVEQMRDGATPAGPSALR